jgi:hypothetical protein
MNADVTGSRDASAAIDASAISCGDIAAPA